MHGSCSDHIKSVNLPYVPPISVVGWHVSVQGCCTFVMSIIVVSCVQDDAERPTFLKWLVLKQNRSPHQLFLRCDWTLKYSKHFFK